MPHDTAKQVLKPPLEIIDAVKGSVSLILDIAKSSRVKLFQLIKSGALNDFGVVEASLQEIELPALSLALSGGGFRATLFHLGILRYLREAGLLGSVREICSVSGGSITAAHLILNWEKYTGSEEDFHSVAAELVAFCQGDLRGKIIRRRILCRLLLMWWVQRFWPTRMLKDAYSKLLRGGVALNLREVPSVEFLSASLTSGEAVAFSRSQVMLQQEEGSKVVHSEQYEIADAVAASSAFPPLFEPVRLDHRFLAVPVGEFPIPHRLTDGGIIDNLGVKRLGQRVLSDSSQSRTMVVSDAGRALDWAVDQKFTSLLSRSVRVSDLLMGQIDDSVYIEMDRLVSLGVDVVPCRIQDIVTAEQDPYAMPADSQRLVARIRTDLDHFTDSEVAALVGHGYAVGRRALEQAFPHFVSTRTPWVPNPAVIDEQFVDTLRKSLRTSEKRRWRLVRWNEFVSWSNLILATLWVLLFALLVYYAVTSCAPMENHNDLRADLLRRVGFRLDEGISGETRSEEDQHVVNHLSLIAYPLPLNTVTEGIFARPKMRDKLREARQALAIMETLSPEGVSEQYEVLRVEGLALTQASVLLLSVLYADGSLSTRESDDLQLLADDCLGLVDQVRFQLRPASPLLKSEPAIRERCLQWSSFSRCVALAAKSILANDPSYGSLITEEFKLHRLFWDENPPREFKIFSKLPLLEVTPEP